MNTITKTTFAFLFIFSSALLETRCSLNDVTIIQELDEFVNQSLNSMEEKSLTPETIQILCNIFFSAFEYSRMDIEYAFLKRNFLSELNKVRSGIFNDSTQPEEIIRNLKDYEKARSRALKRWEHISTFINENENMTNVLNTLATDRLVFLNRLVKNNYQEFSNIITTLLKNTRESTEKINIINNYLQAASEKALPINYEETYAHLQELDILNAIAQNMHNEMDTIRTSLNSIEQYNDTFLTLCALLDMFYFNKLREILVQKSGETCYQTILFNENGLIPEEERVNLLPHVIN